MTKIEPEILTDVDMLAMFKKRIRVEVCHKVLRHAKVSYKHMRNFNKSKDSSSLIYLHKMICMIWQSAKN